VGGLIAWIDLARDRVERGGGGYEHGSKQLRVIKVDHF
jgi:hypothetical protein